MSFWVWYPEFLVLLLALFRTLAIPMHWNTENIYNYAEDFLLFYIQYQFLHDFFSY